MRALRVLQVTAFGGVLAAMGCASTPELRPLSDRVEARTAAVGCAVIDHTVQGGVVRLSGVVPDEESRQMLLSDLRAEEGVQTVVAEDLSVLGRPFCTVLTRLEAAGVDFDSRLSPGVDLDRATAQYAIDEAFVTTVSTRSDAGDELTVFYVHPELIIPMLPAPVEDQRDGSVEPGETVQLGHRADEITADKHGWFVTEPPGPGMIVAISSDQKLFRNPPDFFGEVEEFLTAAELNLDDTSERGLHGTYTVLTVTQ